MKKGLKILVFVFMFLIGINVKANSINSIDMDIYIDKSGNAHITEVWDANLSSGTEGYHPYYNLGNSIIKMNSVRDDLGNDYILEEYWDIDRSKESKAKKFGIYKTGNEVDLCWGITEYGKRRYEIKYTVENFIYNTEDGYQVLYWQLIPYELSSKPNKVYIKVYADQEFEDTLDVWGYGNKGGTAYVYDGYIEMQPNEEHGLDSNEYMTLLVKFPENYFDTENSMSKSFDEVLEMAEKGTDHYENKSSKFDKIIGFFMFFFQALVWFLIIFGITKSASKEANKCGTRQLDFGEEGRKLPKDVNLFRELPCGKDLYKAYWLAMAFNLVKKKTDFLGAILLKWVKESKVEIQNKEKGMIFKKEDTVIVFKENMTFDTTFEEDLYRYMYEASKDGILESKEFEKWCSSHYSKILGWFDKVLDHETDTLTNNGQLVKTTKTTLKIFTSDVYQITPSIREEAIKMKGLKQFFNEFENMKDKEAIEVNMWEEYLMYAQIFGVAEKVAKQFKELYPDLITDQTYNSMVFVNTISTSGMASASTARSRAESYSSGGGGFSSGGGGGGSFGGGGGGGGFR